MDTGFRATFVIPWAQTDIDGVPAASPDVLRVGVAWRWRGAATRVDASAHILRLAAPDGAADLRTRAGRMVRRMMGDALPVVAPQVDDDIEREQGFVVTDGHCSYTATVIAPDTGARVIMFSGVMPPEDRDLWVVRVAMGPLVKRPAVGVICFTPGTRIATPQGARLIDELHEGDLIQTRDNGAQRVIWRGQRHINGARLYAMPHLRPVRLRAGALGVGRPDADLVVSPQHRMLVRGASAQALFNAGEVLVRAQDLLNDGSVVRDHAAREVTYMHLLLEGHNIVWANGLETESFHPGFADLDAGQQAALGGVIDGYGDVARRCLTQAEAAILRHDWRVC
jgi:Hint domain